MTNKVTIIITGIIWMILLLILTIPALSGRLVKNKDYQIEVYNNDVILYDNGNIVSKGKLDSLPQMIIKDNL